MNRPNLKLQEKYDIPAPRYTSYPTVPYWDQAPSEQVWIDSIKSGLKDDSSWALYLHIPFCESLCTFCGCNTTITRNHDLEKDYVEHILNEWDLYKAKVPELKSRSLKQIHLGGGTPTFLSADNLRFMLSTILDDCTFDLKEREASIEVDPRRTTKQQLQVLADLGFNRISIGVQDFNHKVQDLVNRVQSYELTAKVTNEARELGFSSVNFDLIYGLPSQGLDEITHTVEQTIALKPDRIALYSLAIVPWIKPAQKKFTDDQLAKGQDKRDLYERAKEMLLAAGYQAIGMDHFALPNDELFTSIENKSIHRNFMGYTPYPVDVLLGLGVSSISETKDCFHQNEKVLKIYKERVANSHIPTLRGHMHTDEDLLYKDLILKLITTWEVDIPEDIYPSMSTRFTPLLEDKLITVQGRKLQVTSAGKPYIRNICMTFDKRMLDKKPETQIFSQSL